MYKNFKRNIHDFGHEIVIQILISEVCFNICKIIPIIPGCGDDFIPFYFNLNFSKGSISLHSLLLSNLSNEISIKNYLKQYKINFPNKDIKKFEKEIADITKSFNGILPVTLRHKVFAHIDQGFKHEDFMCAYIMPNSIDKYLVLVENLKKSFFNFYGWAPNDCPFQQILKQSESIVKIILDNKQIS